MNRELIGRRYRVLDTIGGGDPPRVFKVEDLAYDVLRALKVGRTRDEVKALRWEFSVLSRLRHPNLVQAFDYNSLGSGEAYFTQEYITGAPLVALRPDSRQGFIQLIEVALQVFEGLAHIHAHGLVHREMKPGNIILARQEAPNRPVEYTARILDFASACPIGSPTATASGPRVSGTPDYQSPEELRGQPVDRRSDYFSVGVILYESMTGVHPYRRDSIQGIMSAHRSRPPSAPRRVNRAVPHGLSELVERLVSPDPARRPDSAEEILQALAAAWRGSRYTPRGPAPVARAGLVAREAAEEAVLRAVEAARAGRPGAVVIHGVHGTGKSTLISQLQQRIEVEGGNCWVTDVLQHGATPFGPVRELLSRGLRERSGEAVLAASRRWLRRLLPELSQRVRRGGEDRRASARVEEIFRNVLVDGVFALARSRRGRGGEVQPLVLVIENLELADQDTLDFVTRFLLAARSLRDQPSDPTPVVLVATEAADSGVVFPQLVRLDPLSDNDSRVLVRSLLAGDDPPFGLTETLHSAAGGNPGEMVQRLRDMIDHQTLVREREGWRVLDLSSAGGSTSELFERRLALASPLERSVLWIAAVLGMDFSLEQIMEVGRFEVTEAMPAVAGLIRAQILAVRFDGHRLLLAFPHAGLRSAVYASIPRADQINLHRFAARFLERHYRRDMYEVYGQLAEHSLAAANPHKALHYSIEAGRRAQETFSHSDAVGHYRQALELWTEEGTPEQRLEILQSLAGALAATGRLDDAREAADEALQWAAQRQLGGTAEAASRQVLARIEQAGERPEPAAEQYRKAIDVLGPNADPRLRAMIQVELAAILTRLGEIQTAIELAEQALDGLLGVKDSGWETGQAYQTFGLACETSSRIDDAVAGYRMALAMLRQTDDLLGAADAEMALGRLAARRGQTAEARQLYKAALETARRNGDIEGQIEVDLLLGTLESAAGNSDLEGAYYAEALALAARTGSARAQVQAHMGLGVFLRRDGRNREAAEHLERAEELAREHNLAGERARLLLSRGFLLKQMGRHQDALRLLEESLAILKEQGSQAGVAACHAHIANILKEQRAWDAAIQHLEESNVIYRRSGARLALAGNLRLLGEIRLEQDRAQEAVALAEQALELAATVRNPRELGLVRMLLGRALHQLGQEGPARGHLAESIQHLEKAGDAYGSNRARLALARALCAAGDPVRAQSLAERAATGFRDLDAGSDLAEANKVLAQIQAAPVESESVRAGVALEVLGSLADLVATLHDRETLVTRILAAGLQISKGERAALLAAGGRGGVAVIGSVRIEPALIEEISELVRPFLEAGPTAPGALYVDDTATDPRSANLAGLRARGTRSLAVLPLPGDSGRTGVLYIDSRSQPLTRDPWLREELAALAAAAGPALAQAERFGELTRQVARAARATGPEPLERLLGASRTMQPVVSAAKAAARSSAAVLISGEPGTGKEILARAIHQAGQRALKPLLALSCRGLPESVIEIELFGGQRTGVGVLRRGRSFLESAQGGTILFTDVDGLTQGLQNRLIQAIEGAAVARSDGEIGIAADVRFIATTSRDVRDLDPSLLRVFGTLKIQLPPLRDRGADIEVMADRFLTEMVNLHGRDPMRLTRDALQALREYTWPGNLNELRATIERAVVVTEDETVRRANLPAEVTEPPQRVLPLAMTEPEPVEPEAPEAPAEAAAGAAEAAQAAQAPAPETSPPEKSLAEVEEAYIRRVLESVGHKKVEACRILGISRPTLDRKIEVYGIEVQRRRRSNQE